MKTFKCNFGDGVSCEVVVTASPPTSGSHIVRLQWTGKPTSRMIRPYIEWMNTVNEELANTWKGALMHVFKVSRKTAEIWVYQPGVAPQRRRVISVP